MKIFAKYALAILFADDPERTPASVHYIGYMTPAPGQFIFGASWCGGTHELAAPTWGAVAGSQFHSPLSITGDAGRVRPVP